MGFNFFDPWTPFNRGQKVKKSKFSKLLECGHVAHQMNRLDERITYMVSFLLYDDLLSRYRARRDLFTHGEIGPFCWFSLDDIGQVRALEVKYVILTYLCFFWHPEFKFAGIAALSLTVFPEISKIQDGHQGLYSKKLTINISIYVK